MLSCYHHFHDHQFLPLASPHSHLGNYIRTRLAKQHTQTTDKTLGQTKIHVGSPDRETERESERGTRTEFVTRTPQRQFFYGDNLNSQVFFFCLYVSVCVSNRTARTVCDSRRTIHVCARKYSIHTIYTIKIKTS